MDVFLILRNGIFMILALDGELFDIFLSGSINWKYQRWHMEGLCQMPNLVPHTLKLDLFMCIFVYCWFEFQLYSCSVDLKRLYDVNKRRFDYGRIYQFIDLIPFQRNWPNSRSVSDTKNKLENFSIYSTSS